MALFNNSFPATYQPYYPQTYHAPAMANQQNSQQQASSGIIWVQGEAGAKSYLVAPNTTVQLWDSENQVIYLKSADASGMPSIKTLDYTVRASETPPDAKKDVEGKYISKNEFEVLKRKIEALEGDLNKMKHAKVKLTKIKEEDDYE